MRENFPAAIRGLKEWEGFKSNDPDDPGGETVFGISRHYHPEMWIDGKSPTWEQAEQFYLMLWEAAGCDGLPWPMDCLHFDATVNPGPVGARSFLKWSSEHTDPYRQATEYCILRIRYHLEAIRKRPVSIKYLAGWTDRTLDFMQRTIISKWDMEVI